MCRWCLARGVMWPATPTRGQGIAMTTSLVASPNPTPLAATGDDVESITAPNDASLDQVLYSSGN